MNYRYKKIKRIIDFDNKIKNDWDQLIIEFISIYRNKLFFNLLSNNENIKMEMIEKFINYNWNFTKVAMNPNLTIDFVVKYQNMFPFFSWCYISEHPSITLENIENNPQLPWIYSHISRNPNLTLDFVKKYENQNWDHFSIIKNDSIDPKEYFTKIGKVYCYDCTLLNKHTAIENVNMDIMTTHTLYKIYTFNGNKKLVLDIINRIDFNILKKKTEVCSIREIQYKERFVIKTLSKIKYFPLEIVENNIELEWEWRFISNNDKINIEFVKKYLDKGWNWASLSKNIPLDKRTLGENRLLPWVYDCLSANKTLTFDMVKRYRQIFKWNWDFISCNSNIDISTIYNNPRYPWEWNFVCLNPNIEINYIMEYADNFNIPIVWFSISRVFFRREKYKFLENKKKEYISAGKIIRWYKKIIYNPRNKYGKKFLNRKFVPINLKRKFEDLSN